MEATALSVGKSVLNGALGYAKSAFAEEVALQLGVRKDHAYVADELEMMRSFMVEAHEERDGSSKVVNTWVKQVRDTAYDVEDILQDFAVRLERPSRWRFLRTLRERRRVAKQMKELRAKVEDVSQRNMRYHLIKGSGSKANTDAAEQSSIIAAALFGVDEARRAAKQENHRVDLVQLINKEDEELKVIAVWGTSGDIGQTTIIRAAYENPDVQSKFPGRAWVRVMHPFSLKLFVQSLVDQFLATEGVKSLLEYRDKAAQDLAREFDGFVNDRRFLVVVTDLCTVEEWDQIKKCFPKNNNGSRIVVSTTQVEVASLCAGQESQASELKKLSSDQILYAFYVKGCQNGKDPLKPTSSLEGATSSTDDHAEASLAGIIGDKSMDADEKVVTRSPTRIRMGIASEESQLIGQEKEIHEVINLLSNEDSLQAQGSQKGKDSMEPTFSSEAATRSTSDHAVAALCEITEDQSKDADEKVVAKSLTRIRTCVGAPEESQLIGREKEIQEVINLLLNEDSQHSQVIAIWGMGGLGKTTLINDVYYSPELNDKFKKRVFVTIMRPFDPVEHLRRLIVGLHERSSTKDELLESSFSNKRKLLAAMGVKELTKELEKLLETTSCLIVLDDMSSTTEWDLTIPKFPRMETSKIIVTTREENIAKHCTGSGKHGTIHNLEVLEPKDAFHLFNIKVFGEARDLVDEKNPELVKEAKQILKKCDGLPLAIAVIGGFLANRPKTPEEWRKLNENISAELEMNPELETIRTILEKSYDGLPYELKSCFLYLSIFPEDHIISRRLLVRRWTAEGYSSERHGKSASEIADNYFMELKNRSMILPSQHSAHSRKLIDSCKVHDLIRDIAISKSGEENLVFRLEEGCSLNAHGAIRHLSITGNWKGDQSEFEKIVDQSRIRSLSLFGRFRPFFVSDKMRFLRVLDLEGTNGLYYYHLDPIWKLLHLKYLSLRRCDDIQLLPDSLGNLRQLQMLDVRDTIVDALPKSIVKLQKLQYIHAGRKSNYITQEKNNLMKRCLEGSYLCATCCLPIFMSFMYGPCLKALTRRDTCSWACCVQFPAVVTGADEERGATMPKGTRILKGLHTLREVNVGRGSVVLRDIQMLTGLRKLGVAGISKKNGPAFRSAISNLRKLESLSVRPAVGKMGLRGCLDGISSPPENLQSLKLYGNLEALPEWIKELRHLVKLNLVESSLLDYDAALEFIGKLATLKILGLSGLSSDGENLDFKKPKDGTVAFGSLNVLILAGLRKFKLVKFEEGAMPKLELLQVMGTVNNEIAFSGLEFLPSINQVELRHVYLRLDDDTRNRLSAAHDSEAWRKIFEKFEQEERRKVGELKTNFQEQLVGHPNQPIVTVD